MKKLLISACLLGDNVKYNGGNNKLDELTLLSLKKEYHLIPFCPEVEAGLSTPRTPAEILGENVVTKDGIDVSKEFHFGAKKTLEFCKKNSISIALLKDGSPSCGTNFIYDGTFSKKKVKDLGVTAKLLKKEGIKVFSESNI